MDNVTPLVWIELYSTFQSLICKEAVFLRADNFDIQSVVINNSYESAPNGKLA